jgi:hypothetical protein
MRGAPEVAGGWEEKRMMTSRIEIERLIAPRTHFQPPPRRSSLLKLRTIFWKGERKRRN